MYSRGCGKYTTTGALKVGLQLAKRCSIAAQRSGAELRRPDRSARRSGRFQLSKWRRSCGRTAASAPAPCWAARSFSRWLFLISIWSAIVVQITETPRPVATAVPSALTALLQKVMNPILFRMSSIQCREHRRQFSTMMRAVVGHMNHHLP